MVIASDEYPISIRKIKNIEYLNILITILFSIQLGVGLTASGFKDFPKVSKQNILDAFIVVLSIIDVFIANLFIS